MRHNQPAYGLWLLVSLNSAIFIMFAYNFFKPATACDCALSERLRIVMATGDGLTTGADVAMNSAQLTLVNMKQNLLFALLYNTLGIPIAAGVMIAALAMSCSSVSAIGNALRLRPSQE